MMNVLRSTICTNLVRNSFKYSRQFHPVMTATLVKNNQRGNQSLNLNLYSTTAAAEAENGGIFNKIFSKLANSKSRLRSSSVLLYESFSDNLNYQEWFDEFGMPDTFNSWFLVTELHCWLILTRVMNEGAETGEDGRFIRNCIVEAMWSDVQQRSKKLTADNPSACRQQISVLAEQFQATLINYDEGMMSDDKILASALWRRFFTMECEDYSKLEKLVKYVRRVSQQLEGMTRQDLMKPKIDWGSISSE